LKSGFDVGTCGDLFPARCSYRVAWDRFQMRYPVTGSMGIFSPCEFKNGHVLVTSAFHFESVLNLHRLHSRESWVGHLHQDTPVQ
jgi:hypothetical protein